MTAKSRCFGAQVLQNTFAMETPTGNISRALFYPLNELDELVSTLSGGAYDLPPGVSPRRVIDVGAHVGGFSALVKALYPEAQVVCFEATPDTASLLDGNFSEVDGVRVGRLAVAEQAGPQRYYLDPFRAANDTLEPVPAWFENIVEVEGFDSAELRSCFPGEQIDVLKLSVNGAELRILRRAREVRRHVAWLLVRITGTDRREAVLAELHDFALVREAECPGGSVLTFLRRQ